MQQFERHPLVFLYKKREPLLHRFLYFATVPCTYGIRPAARSAVHLDIFRGGSPPQLQKPERDHKIKELFAVFKVDIDQFPDPIQPVKESASVDKEMLGGLDSVQMGIQVGFQSFAVFRVVFNVVGLKSQDFRRTDHVSGQFPGTAFQQIIQR